MAPRGIYTSGQGSFAIGLTSYVSKDPENGEILCLMNLTCIIESFIDWK